MIATFKIKTKLCKKHHLLQAFICIHKDCLTNSLLCSRCVKTEHHHIANIYSLEKFSTYFSDFITKAKDTHENNMCSLDISLIIKEKKREVQQMQLQLLQHVMKRLSDEKKSIFEQFDKIQWSYQEKENEIKKNRLAREEIINYLVPYTQNKELFELKLLSSSGWGLTRLKEQLLELEYLANRPDRHQTLCLQQAIINQTSQKLERSFSKNLKFYIKQQSIVFRPPLPDKVFSFKGRKHVQHSIYRPNSSIDLKTNKKELIRTGTSSQRNL